MIEKIPVNNTVSQILAVVVFTLLSAKIVRGGSTDEITVTVMLLNLVIAESAYETYPVSLSITLPMFNF
jgi:hypothetical protein